ncbi:MAG: hypothetical protein R3246_08765 [Acidimicrobiia bacterium]|nr:hypothetical protein [Acidimicrobiia bacterium]
MRQASRTAARTARSATRRPPRPPRLPDLGLVAPVQSAAAVLADFAAVAHTVYDLGEESFADNDPIATLTDQTGNTNDATQGTASNRPLKQTQDGIAVARFDGTNDRLDSSTFTALTDPITVITLQRFNVATTAAGTPVGLSNAGGLSLIHAYVTGSSQWSIWNGLAVGQGSTIDTNWHVAVTTFVDSPSTLYVDGNQDLTRTGNPTNTDQIVLGDRTPSTAVPFEGDIAYFGLYDGNLRVDDLTLLNDLGQALADRVGISWTDIT